MRVSSVDTLQELYMTANTSSTPRHARVGSGGGDRLHLQRYICRPTFNVLFTNSVPFLFRQGNDGRSTLLRSDDVCYLVRILI